MSDANSSPENISLRERFFNNIVGRILSGELRRLVADFDKKRHSGELKI